MVEYVPHISVQDGDDLVVSFALGEHSGNYLTLMRTPKYESLSPEEERGVCVSPREDCSQPPEMLRSLQWGVGTLVLRSNRYEYRLDLGAVDAREIAEARALLQKMNFDGKFRWS
ncbi:MAG TPA: hypothetical protein VJ001_01595 [Rhodocyclaceae bacterium]|nr:hypothetical protein [Rhodocyclaceae bacterium]